MDLTFLILAAGLVVLTLLALLRPWQRSTASQAPDATRLNTTLYREQLAELDRELALGSLAAGDHATARAELERRLLDDLPEAPAVPAGTAGLGRGTLVALLLSLPLAAAGLYRWLGTPEALDPAQRVAATHEVTSAQIEQMVAKLAAKLAASPDDPKGWAMLGRSYHAMGRMAEAAQALEHVGPSLQQDANLLAVFADVLATQAKGQLAGRPSELVKQALAIDPDEPMALSLAATAAFQQEDKATAIRHWTHLLAIVPPESEEARWLKGQLAEMGAAPAAPVAAASGPAPAAAAATGQGISGHVSLAPALALKLNPEATLFLFARADQGSRMPLAILRLTAGQLPLDFKLDDSHAMSPAAKLSGAQQVVVEARISQSRDAKPAPGDLFGLSATVSPGATGLQIVIDQVR